MVEDEVYKARYVVNCAGLFSDKVAAMVGDDSFTIKPRIGEYVLMKRPAITNKARVNHRVVFLFFCTLGCLFVLINK